MGNRLIAALAVFVCLALSASAGAAPTATNPDNSDSGNGNNSGFGIQLSTSGNTTSGFGVTIPINVPPCKAPSGGYTLCRWDNIQIEYLNTRLNRFSSNYWTTLVIKGKDREINLIYQYTNPSVANAVASCERMATSSLGGLGFLSFYANIMSTSGAEIVEGFNENKVTVYLDSGSPNYLELGCFLTSGNP
jgi:hypothetical protein